MSDVRGPRSECQRSQVAGPRSDVVDIGLPTSQHWRLTMYKRILVAIENSAADRTIIDHVTELVRLTGASLLLVHVADGWAARHYDELQLRESEEMISDREYLARLQSELQAQGFTVETCLRTGDPARELV